MKTKTRFLYQKRLGFVIAVLLLLCEQTVLAQGTAFTYQGKLSDGGNPANGNYDLQFALFDSLALGNQIGSTLPRANTNVAGGIFTVQLDFGVNAFPGANRFLEIGVRPANSGGFTILTPRQQINSTPYAIRTLTATNSTQLGGVAASQYVQTNDSRLSDTRSPSPGSANYIQNTTTQQSANFNISGNGRIAGNLGIGTSIPSNNPLHIVGNNPQLLLEGPSGIAYIQFSSPSSGSWVTGIGLLGDYSILSGNGRGIFTMTQSGDLGIGTIQPQRLLDVDGRARIGHIPPEASFASVCFNFAGDLLQCGASSLRLKKNIAQFRNGLDIVRRLRPISFDWKDGTGHDIGLGAEDVAKVAPSFTFTDKKGEVAGVKYERLNILLINAVKEQQQQIEQMRAANANLNSRLRAVEKRLRQQRLATRPR